MYSKLNHFQFHNLYKLQENNHQIEEDKQHKAGTLVQNRQGQKKIKKSTKLAIRKLLISPNTE